MKTAQDLVAAAKAGITEVALEGAEEAVLAADVLIDVREGNEYQDGHIGGAINIPRGLLEFMLSTDESLQDRSRRYLLYCKTSGRAALSAKTMEEMGYLHVKSIDGGFDAWKESGKPVAHPSSPDFG
ncbi:rhodanese-like domain-containing protein [Congregibacter litoralis]|uniref:Rhodanese-related protein sulfurtransferase n=1 Tax=Congregibacter litoralis KT71 TaxID=314285 RepID=A4ACS5_9GAMM|nr:rhodanese-like domain-containing protein [Congregibacter litoralis]EAQ96290.1 Rhodanese-related protein sulfurtransferase [Congregibacter litoralis KT71]